MKIFVTTKRLTSSYTQLANRKADEVGTRNNAYELSKYVESTFQLAFSEKFSQGEVYDLIDFKKDI